MTGWMLIAIGIFAMSASGCIRIPEESWTVSHRGAFETRRQAADCTASCLAPPVPDQINPSRMALAETIRTPALNADGFSLVSWNIFKGMKEGWAEDFQKFSRNTDIFILQEAYLTDSFKKVLIKEGYQWDMTAAFEYLRVESGVLTAARTAPTYSCTFLETEPITRIPKSVLITRYPMTKTDRKLLVANIHAINFSMGNAAFKKQIARLENILAAHRGPMIVSGDFNTWNNGRISRVNTFAKVLDLTAVRFDENKRSQFFGYDVDHIYYRGLEAENAAIPIVSTSDHNPLTVVFKLVQETDSCH